jgi:twitching motility protein PilT
MPQIDSLLRIVEQQGANELRLGSDRAPSMFADAVPKKLTIPATPTAVLLELFGELLSERRRGELEKLGRVEFDHEAPGIAAYSITLTKRPTSELAFDAIVKKRKAPVEGQRAGPLRVPEAPKGLTPSGLLPKIAANAPVEPLLVPDAAPRALAQPSSTLPLAPLGPYRVSEDFGALVERAVGLGASDLHLSEREPPVARVHGTLSSLHAESVPLGSWLQGLLGQALLDQLHVRSSLDLAVELASGHRGRMNVYRSSAGLSVAIRVLTRQPPTLAELSYPMPIDDLAMLPSGLVIVTGATGSGKSTTLGALAREVLAKRSVVLLTLEDPVEYDLPSSTRSLVRQRQIGRDVPDFARGLRDALREDPDVILVGEMRDPESIHLALTAAETGHLVLSSLHARSASAAVERILDTYAAERQQELRIMLADSLRAVVAQRLVPRANGYGRALAVEVLRVTTGVAASIRDGKVSGLRSAMQAGRDFGMIPLERHLSDLTRARVITLEEARAQANDPILLTQYLSDPR